MEFPPKVRSQHLGLESDNDRIEISGASEFTNSEASKNANPSMDSWRLTWYTPFMETPWFLLHLLGDSSGLRRTEKLGLAEPKIVALSWDMIDLRGEVELSHPYYYVADHISPEGTGRFIRLHEGRQEIQYFRPDPEPKSLEAIQECIVDRVRGKSSKGYSYSVTLHPGDILVLPPCTVHRTYTAAHTIIERKHFYAWDMLHLTELALKLNVEHSRLLTHSQHPSSLRLLARMAISLGRGRKGPHGFYSAVPLRVIHALARVLRNPTAYAPRDDKEKVAKMLKADLDDLIWREHRADVLLGRTILELLDLVPGEPDMEADYDGGLDWDDAGPRQDVKAIPLDEICSKLHQLYCAHMATGLELSSIPAETMDELRLLVENPPPPPPRVQLAKRPRGGEEQVPGSSTTAAHNQAVERAAKKGRFTE
ncbi:hypothetical protein EXIGLDRAFT_844617 [Exidia glandulosa HHB12029]|uniref:JmjC domain-containing protein n=1 Tax=Exidia glandulosa HHB12029 TaxID=1314781 RepID=A0A165BXN6_EXIGL|nr:hypothetical protein EXIGLDRAFT_844617 [Exidia glandulosa HHB12029]